MKRAESTGLHFLFQVFLSFFSLTLASPNVGCSENPLHKINFNYEG